MPLDLEALPQVVLETAQILAVMEAQPEVIQAQELEAEVLLARQAQAEQERKGMTSRHM